MHAKKCVLFGSRRLGPNNFRSKWNSSTEKIVYWERIDRASVIVVISGCCHHSEKFGQLFNTKVYKSSEINIARGRRKKKKNTVGERISTDCWQAAHSYFGLASLTFLKKLFAAKLHLTLSEKYETCIARSRFV